MQLSSVCRFPKNDRPLVLFFSVCKFQSYNIFRQNTLRTLRPFDKDDVFRVTEDLIKPERRKVRHLFHPVRVDVKNIGKYSATRRFWHACIPAAQSVPAHNDEGRAHRALFKANPLEKSLHKSRLAGAKVALERKDGGADIFFKALGGRGESLLRDAAPERLRLLRRRTAIGFHLCG